MIYEQKTWYFCTFIYGFFPIQVFVNSDATQKGVTNKEIKKTQKDTRYFDNPLKNDQENVDRFFASIGFSCILVKMLA